MRCRGLLDIFKTFTFIFNTIHKMNPNLGQFIKLKCWKRVQFCKLPQLCNSFFCRVLKMKVIFWNIFSNPRLFIYRNSLTNQFFKKKVFVCQINSEIVKFVIKNSAFNHFQTPNFLSKYDWSMNLGRQRARYY